MEYKYITDDNLINKQNYMYSDFGGAEFLKAYANSREEFIKDKDKFVGRFHDTRKELGLIISSLQEGDHGPVMESLNSYVKRYEVTKRLYTEYDESWKPTVNSSFEEMDVYLALARGCLLTYRLTKCTKYLSCLLKVTDTLLSVRERLTYGQSADLADITVCERKEIDMLCETLKVEV